MKNIIVSKYSNYNTPTPIEDIKLLDWLKDETHKEIVKKIRTLTTKEERKKFKSRLPSITPSGTFIKRNAKELLIHSGYICIDIDADDNPHIKDFENLRDELKKVKNIAYAALSVSGQGVFCLIPIKNSEKHKEHFEALKIQFSNIGIKIDAACSDVARLRGYSYDENAFLNENAIVFNQIYEYKNLIEDRLPINLINKNYKDFKSSSEKKVLKIIELISNSSIDITEKYEQWFQIGCALANEFGEEGRELFQKVSENHPKYNPSTCDNLYSKCLIEKYSYTIGTFFHWAEEYGLK